VTEAEGRAEWERRSRAMEEGQARIGAFPVPGLLRRARRLADLSQHQLATRAGVPQSTVARVESGKLAPSLRMFQRLLAAAGLSLVVVDADGRVIQPMRESDDVRNGGDRRYPSHLDTILDPRSGEWWGDAYGLARPPETFWRNRARRDAMRAMSEYETRAHLHRHESPPPEWGAITRLQVARAWQLAYRLARIRAPNEVDPNDLDWDDNG
jgi:transcriptional regulator with XRE-family HTH domain